MSPRNLPRLLDEMRKIDPTMGTQTLLAFVHIALDDSGLGYRQSKLVDALGCSSASATRNVTYLSDGVGSSSRVVKGGLDLVFQAPDPDDPRHKRLHLTHKGRLVWRSMKEIMEA